MDIVTYALCKKLIKTSIEALGDVFSLKGNVASTSQLPSTGNKAGDIYLVGPNQQGSYDEYYWTSNGDWEIMGSTGPNYDDIITEETMYKGQDGTGTIEDPAEDTILYEVNNNFGNYVSKNGDTMTGKLTVPSLSVGISNTVMDGCTGEGTHVEAMNLYSHAEGYYTHATGKYSHAEGDYSTASGEDSHAEGYTTVAQARYTHAEGNSTNAFNQSQHVQGEWNVQDHTGTASTRGTYAHIIGNGTGENARSNAHTLDWSGNAWFAGDVYVGSTSGTNKDAGSKKLATDDTFIGTNGTENGSKGLVPAPTSQDTNKYLKADGTWDTPQGGGGGSYTAGDYIDITNNEISVTGIVPGMTVEEIPLTSGYSYGYVPLSEPLPSPTVDANGKIGVIENTTNAAQTIYIRCSGEPNYDDNSYAFKTHYGSEEYPTDEVATVRYSEPGQNTTERYFGTVLEPGEKLYFSFHQTNVTPASVYKYTFENSESLTMIPDHSAVYDSQNEVVDVVAIQGDTYAVFVNNTGNTGMFYFKGQGYSGMYPLIHTDSNNNVIWVFKMSSDYLDFYGDEFYFWGVEMNPGDKFYITYDNDYIAIATRVYGTPGVLSDYTKFTDTFVGTDGTSNGKAGVVPAPTSSDANKYLKSDGTWGTVSAGSSDYDDLTDKPQINGVTLSGNKTSADLGLDMVILSYGNSTWQDFINAYRRNAVVYCRAGSGSDPASGNQPRLAFMAYINNVTNPTEVEFQYYRSVSTKTASQQGDQVIVYKLTSSGTWTVTTRENGSKVVAGTNMTSSYSNGVLTLNASDSIFEGTDGTNAGTKGLVPAPTASDTDKYLKSDGTWATVSGGSGNYVSKTGDTMTGTLTTPNIIVGNQKNSTTLGTKSSIFGRDGTASGNYCIVEGDGCTAKDDACHAEGRNCIAGAGGNGGDYAHAEGCETKATGFCSHSEGYYTTASEYYAHAEGEKTVAAGTHSHAEGYGTKANRGFTHVQGIYNILDDTGAGSSKGTYAHIVGNGSADNDRKNIHTIKWTGETWFQGDVYVGSTSGKNKDEGSKKLATEDYVRNLLQEFATLNNLNMPD